MPLRLFDKQRSVWSTIAQRLPDPHAQQFVTHTREALLTQEVYPILAGYPDGNDAQQLRHDPLFQTLVAAVPEVAKAEVGTLRQQLWKVDAVIKTSVRRIGFHLSETWPHRRLFVAVYQAVCSYVGKRRSSCLEPISYRSNEPCADGQGDRRSPAEIPCEKQGR